MGKGLDGVGIRAVQEPLADLIARVEAGEGADRELDFAVGLASGFWRLDEPAEDGTRLVTYMHPIYKTVWHGAIGACIPSLTTSLDAVVLLVEQRLPLAEWEVTTTGFKPGATVIPNGSKHGGAYASSPARALLAAFLRALQDLENSPASLADANQNQIDEAEHG